jgi:hypothetical protein
MAPFAEKSKAVKTPGTHENAESAENAGKAQRWQMPKGKAYS